MYGWLITRSLDSKYSYISLLSSGAILSGSIGLANAERLIPRMQSLILISEVIEFLFSLIFGREATITAATVLSPFFIFLSYYYNKSIQVHNADVFSSIFHLSPKTDDIF